MTRLLVGRLAKMFLFALLLSVLSILSKAQNDVVCSAGFGSFDADSTIRSRHSTAANLLQTSPATCQRSGFLFE
jgi:hypothetical protein